MNFSTSDQIEEGKRLGIDVSSMTVTEAKKQIKLAVNTRLAAKAKAMNLSPGAKVRRIRDGMEGVVNTVHIKPGANVGITLKGKPGYRTVITRDEELVWEVIP